MNLAEMIKKLTCAYGVSGDEFRVSRIAAEMMEPYFDRVDIDDFGNVLGRKDCGIPGAKTLLLDPGGLFALYHRGRCGPADAAGQ